LSKADRFVSNQDQNDQPHIVEHISSAELFRVSDIL